MKIRTRPRRRPGRQYRKLASTSKKTPSPTAPNERRVHSSSLANPISARQRVSVPALSNVLWFRALAAPEPGEGGSRAPPESARSARSTVGPSRSPMPPPRNGPTPAKTRNGTRNPTFRRQAAAFPCSSLWCSSPCAAARGISAAEWKLLPAQITVHLIRFKTWFADKR